MTDVVADTNILVWYFTDPTGLPSVAETAVDRAAATGVIFVSSITLVEITYLIEKGRIRHDILDLLREALDDPATGFRLVDIGREIAEALSRIPRSIVADMPDRIVAATALHLGLPLITSDSDIRKLTNIETIW